MSDVMYSHQKSKVVSGRAWTKNDTELLTDMKEDFQKKVMEWIRENIQPRKTPLLTHSSYGIKHLLERDTGIYMTNNQFKDAMLLCGYYPVDEYKLNWNYRISKKSKAFERKLW